MMILLLEHGASPDVEPGGMDLVELVREAGSRRGGAVLERARHGEPLRGVVEAPAGR